MNNYRMLIQYDGGRYKGWQRLGQGEHTIQEKLENVLSELTGEKIELIGSSRTDAGVHALAQVANFTTRKNLSEAEIKAYCNQYLPQDICVEAVTRVSKEFHARFQTKGKTYLYQIWNKDYPNPFLRKYSMHVQEMLDVAQMKRAAEHFVGVHDFTTFSNAKSKKKSMVREIHALRIEEQDGKIEIRVSGNGFLYNMVRKMVGTLLAVGLGELAADSIPQLLEAKDRGQCGRTAEACGLFLECVEY